MMNLPFDRECWRFASILAVIAFLLSIINVHLGWFGFLLVVFCIAFFRDPVRISPIVTDEVLSPADGIILAIEEVSAPKDFEMQSDTKFKKISIFMSVFDVHINRAPVNCIIERILYFPGKYFNASLDKASEHNERQVFFTRTPEGKEVIFVQIAGLIARRIRCDIAVGDEMIAGEKIGMIRFGSRMDVYLPTNAKVCVLEGQTMVAGETIIATLQNK